MKACLARCSARGRVVSDFRSSTCISSAPYSTLHTPRRRERVSVPCRSNGAVDIDILHSASAAAPVLIHLPAGPVIPEDHEGEEVFLSALSLASGATIARIAYRASPLHPYPTPVHDVLAGLDWIKENLLRDAFSRPIVGRMGVCGELVGGSLAVMLGLTECRRAESRIAAVAVSNPVADWVFADDLPAVPLSEIPEPLAPEETALPAEEDLLATNVPPTRKKRATKSKTHSSTAWQLHGQNEMLPTATLSAVRDTLFRRPEHMFDRFASPLHFFRSPHGALLPPKDDDTAASEQPAAPVDFETQMDILHFESVRTSSPDASGVPLLTRCRAYARVYPPAGAPELLLPSWYVTTGEQSPLSDQAAELVKMLRRSIARQTLQSVHGRARWHDEAEKARLEALAERKVSLGTTDGVGLWTLENSPRSESKVEEIGKWFGEQLAPEFG